MHLSQFYPKFTIEDDWGRQLEFNRTNSGYTRRLLNAGMPGIPLQEEHSISRHTYALALLNHLEELADLPDLELKPNAPTSPGLDEFFGPRQSPFGASGR